MLDDSYFMKQALIEAVKAGERGEVPVGAVVVCKERIIALYWGALIVGGKDFLLAHCNVIYLIIMVMLFSWLLVAEIPMFSLKFKNLSWKDNKVSFIFLIVCIPLLQFLGISGFSAVIVWYIILSLLTRKNKKTILLARLLYYKF